MPDNKPGPQTIISNFNTVFGAYQDVIRFQIPVNNVLVIAATMVYSAHDLLEYSLALFLWQTISPLDVLPQVSPICILSLADLSNWVTLA